MARRALPTRAQRCAPLFALAALVGVLSLPGVAASGGQTGASFVDYAQCANGSPPSVAITCTGGWLNGILQSSNSHYAEDQVSAQRLEVMVPAGSPTTARTLTVEYMTRKGASSIHAYDYLTTWNLTESGADRCQGLVVSDCVTPVQVASCPNQPSASSPSTLTIPLDPNPVYPVGAGIDPVTSTHQVAGVMTMYGGCIDSISTPVHSASPTAVGTDDTATQVVTYHVNGTSGTTTADQKVQLLFGGHLATGAGIPRGWGANLGASSASGGPYHIKLAAVDGSSVGNRDNQIQAASVLIPNLQLAKTADAPSVNAGIAIGFTVTVSNPQNASLNTGDAESVTVDDPLPTGGDITWSISPAYSGPGTCSVTGTPQVLSCSLGKMLPSDSVPVHLVSQTDRSSCGAYGATADAKATNSQQVTAAASTTVICPSAVALASFQARRSGEAVRLTWRTGTDAGLLGFRVWRSTTVAGRYAKVTRSLIPASSAAGAAYRYLDRTSREGFYKLELVGLEGHSRFTGPVRAALH